MSKKEEIVKKIKKTMGELDKLIARRNELEKEIHEEEKECFTILNKALQEIEHDILN